MIMMTNSCGYIVVIGVVVEREQEADLELYIEIGPPKTVGLIMIF